MIARDNGELTPISHAIKRWARQRRLHGVPELRLWDGGQWARLVGDDLAAAGRPVRLDDGVLQIEAFDELGATRLEYTRAAIMSECNRAAGATVVRSVVIRREHVGPTES